jgi:hypothetical protein
MVSVVSARTRIRLALLATAVVGAVVLGGCSSSNKSPDSSTLPASGTTPGSASTGTVSKMSMRVVNLFDPKQAAGPALDIYDVQLTGQKATPIAADLAYGSVSPYFAPHAEDGSVRVQLYALPAGEDPVTDQADAQNMGGADDDGSHPQITWVLTADTGSTLGNGPLAGLSFSSKVEKGTNNGSTAPLAPAPPSGEGELMVDTAALIGTGDLFYLMVDDSCDPALNGDASQGQVPKIFAVDGKAPVSGLALFATAPGTHQVSVVAWTDSTPPTCAQLTTKQGATSLDVTDGQQIETYLYGTSDTDLHLALAPIRQ